MDSVYLEFPPTEKVGEVGWLIYNLFRYAANAEQGYLTKFVMKKQWGTLLRVDIHINNIKYSRNIA